MFQVRVLYKTEIFSFPQEPSKSSGSATLIFQRWAPAFFSRTIACHHDFYFCVDLIQVNNKVFCIRCIHSIPDPLFNKLFI